MHKIQRTIDISASAQRVYDFVIQPKNLPGVLPSLIEVSNVVAGTGGGSDYDWIYKMVGVHLKGHTTIEQAQPGKLLRHRGDGAIQSTWRWTFQGHDGAGMKLTCEVEYTIPVPVLGKLAEALVVKLNIREMETMLANVKDMVEHGAASAGAGASAH